MNKVTNSQAKQYRAEHGYTLKEAIVALSSEAPVIAAELSGAVLYGRSLTNT
jgi:hypothetical protein